MRTKARIVQKQEQMKSTLTRAEFQARLAECTAPGGDFYLITPYNFSGKPFCGTFDDSRFDLRRNSSWSFVWTIHLKGEYTHTDDGTTQVIYSVGESRFSRNLQLLLIGLFFIGMNTSLLFFSSLAPGDLAGINFFFLIACLGTLLLTRLTAKLVNQRFKEEFEIGIEDEWEKLAKTNR